MPTTKFKNAVYRMMLPFFAPSCEKNPVSYVGGHTVNELDAFVNLIRKHHVLGSATVISDGKNEAMILTDSEKPLHHTHANTYFRVASITKIATAVLTMRLAEQNLLDLDEPVLSYLSPDTELPLSLKRITLRHLLSHTSGLKDPPSLEKDIIAGKSINEVLQQTSDNNPGSSFLYSNLGYGIIGCVMEAVMKQPVDQIFASELFTPLGMDATLSACLLPADRIMPVTRILPYHEGNDLILTPLGRIPLTAPDPLHHFGHTAGSMYTTVHSLVKLLSVLTSDENSYLSPTSVSEMKKQHAAYGALSPTLSYGLGILRINDNKISRGLVLGHQGFAYGCGDGAFWEEETKRMIVFLNGGCSEARTGRLGSSNRDFACWAFQKELPSW